MARYALVTGSSSGLGFEIVQYLLDNDYTVFGASRRGASINHPNYIDLVVDLRDEPSVEEMFSEINGHTPGLNLIVHAAGIFQWAPLAETSSDEFWGQLEGNVLTLFHLMKHLNHYVIENETHVVAISSNKSLKDAVALAAFGASQSAIDSLIESCRKEWKELGVRISLLQTGPIDTPLWNEVEGFVAREKMLEIDDFMNIFSMVEKSSKRVSFDKLIFGPIER